MKEIYYVHKETGIKRSRDYFKQKPLDDTFIIKQLKPILTVHYTESLYDTYQYLIKDIPFNDDFETVIVDEENQFKFGELRFIDNALMCQEDTDPKLLEKCKRMLDIEFEKIKRGEHEIR